MSTSLLAAAGLQLFRVRIECFYYKLKRPGHHALAVSVIYEFINKKRSFFG